MARTKGQTGQTGQRRPLDEACFQGNVEEVRRLLSSEASHSTTTNGNHKRPFAEEGTPMISSTPSHWASSEGRLEVLSILKDHYDAGDSTTTWNFVLETKNDQGRTVLGVAQNRKTVRLLLETGARLEHGGHDVLVNACESKDADFVDELLKEAAVRGILPSLVESGRALSVACLRGRFDIARSLMQHGSEWRGKDVNGRGPFDFSLNALPSRWRTRYEHLEDASHVLAFLDFITEQEVLYEKLRESLHAGDADVVRELLEKGAFPNSLNPESPRPSPLGIAVSLHQIDTVRLLLEKHGADVNEAGPGRSYYDAPLIIATRDGEQELFDLLTKTYRKAINVNVNVADACSYTPLHYACQQGRVDMVRTLLEKGADVRFKTDDSNGGCPPLHFACRWAEAEPGNGDKEEEEKKSAKVRIVQLLLEYGSDPNAKEFDNHQTPLHLLAASRFRSPKNNGRGDVDAVRLLLQHGANVDATEGRNEDDEYYDPDDNQPGHTALNLAMEWRNYDIARALIVGGGADVRLRSGILMSDGMTNLHKACWCPRFGGRRRVVPLIRLLVEKGIGIEDRFGDDEDRTALFMACQEGNRSVVEILLSLGADPFFCSQGTARSCLEAAWESVSEKEEFTRLFQTTVELAQACREGNVARMQSILGQERRSVFARVRIPETGWYALHYVALHGSTNAVERLIAQGADLGAKTPNGQRPVDIALKAGHEDIVKCLRRYENDNASYDLRRSLMSQEEVNDRLFQLLEAEADDNNSVEHWINNAGARVNCRNSKGRTPLHVAVSYGDVKATKMLIGCGGDVDAKDVGGSVPLHECGEFLRVAILMCDHGANVNVSNNDGDTPLRLASKYHDRRVAEFLLGRGADISVIPPNSCWSQHSLWNNSINLVRAILNNDDVGDDWSTKHVFGQIKIPTSKNKPVSLLNAVSKTVGFVKACQQGRLDVVEEFSRSNVFDDRTEGELLLHYFCRRGNEDMVKHLVDSCGALPTRDDNGSSPLIVAAQHGSVGVVRFFLSRLVSENSNPSSDRWGNTPLHHACRNGCLEIVRLLLGDNHTFSTSTLLTKWNWLSETPRNCAVSHDRTKVVEYLDGLL